MEQKKKIKDITSEVKQIKTQLKEARRARMKSLTMTLTLDKP